MRIFLSQIEPSTYTNSSGGTEHNHLIKELNCIFMNKNMLCVSAVLSSHKS